MCLCALIMRYIRDLFNRQMLIVCFAGYDILYVLSHPASPLRHLCVHLAWLSFESTCFSLLISHPSQRLTASPRPPLIYPSAGTRWTSVHLLLSSTHTHTHTHPFFSLSFSFCHNPIFSSVISLRSLEPSRTPMVESNNSPVCMGSVCQQ